MVKNNHLITHPSRLIICAVLEIFFPTALYGEKGIVYFLFTKSI